MTLQLRWIRDVRPVHKKSWSRVTSDGGLVLIRELDERLGFGELVEEYLTDARAKNGRLPFPDLLRQSVYSRLAGYDVDDAEGLCHDPAHRLRGSGVEARL